MKKFGILSKLISLTLILGSLMSALLSCKTPDTPEDPDIYDLTGYQIVKTGNSGSALSKYTANLKKSIEQTTGLSLSVSLDDDLVPSDSAKEILIGATNRKASGDAAEYLESHYEEDAYIIQINENNIVITGSTQMATVRAIKVFMEKYVYISSKGCGINISAGNQISDNYNAENIITASNGVEFETNILSTVYEVPANGMDTSLTDSRFMVSNISYPSIIKLAHQKNEKDNGKLIAVFYLASDNLSFSDPETGSCVMMSKDEGKTWSCISRPVEEIDTFLECGQMAHIYELSEKVGDMPAGTLLYSANSVNYKSKSNISVWRSFDCGTTWEQYICIASAGGDKEGVWEPFMMYCEEDKYLYCFYSDDSDPAHDQKIVYKRSKDGENWENSVEVIACNDKSYRPGMPVITKMGNGEYFMVYEIVHEFKGEWISPIYCKSTKDFSDWGNENDHGTRIELKNGYYMGSGPSCAWLCAGGDCGTLVVTAKYGSPFSYVHDKIFVSFDYGKTWETIHNPLSYEIMPVVGDRFGYSAGLWVGEDGKTLYYINCINAEHNKAKRRIAFAKINIY